MGKVIPKFFYENFKFNSYKCSSFTLNLFTPLGGASERKTPWVSPNFLNKRTLHRPNLRCTELI